MGISRLNPSEGGIPYGNTASRPANPEIGKLYSNGEVGRLELYTSTGWENIVQETPGVTSIAGHYYESDNSGTFSIYGTNFVNGSIAYAIGTNAVSYQATTTTYNSIVELTAVFDNLSGAYEPYDIKVINPSNLFGLLPDAFFINESPVWGTTAGSLGSIITGDIVNIQLSSTDDESDSRTYVLSSGTLPSGLSLSSSGLISGTASGNTSQTYSFTITVSDAYNAPASRSFSLAYTSVAVVTGGTLTSDSTYYYRTFTGNGTLSVSNGPLSNVDYLVVAGGGAGGNYTNNTGGGGGAGGLRSTVGATGGGGSLESSVTLTSGNYSITVGGGGTTNGNSQVIGGAGSDSTFNGITSKGGSGGGSGAQGGSGGGGNLQTANGGYGNGGAGTIGQGFAGGNGIAITSDAGGGGGGAGGAGTSGQNAVGGNAGNGVSITALATPTSTGASGYYAGGGGGGVYSGTTYGNGGLGGGGRGGYSTTAPVAGTANTGGGGGGSGTGNNPVPGGSGIVIVRYTKSQVGG